MDIEKIKKKVSDAIERKELTKRDWNNFVDDLIGLLEKNFKKYEKLLKLDQKSIDIAKKRFDDLGAVKAIETSDKKAKYYDYFMGDRDLGLFDDVTKNYALLITKKANILANLFYRKLYYQDKMSNELPKIKPLIEDIKKLKF